MCQCKHNQQKMDSMHHYKQDWQDICSEYTNDHQDYLYPLLDNIKQKRTPRLDDSIQHFAVFFQRGSFEKETFTMGENKQTSQWSFFFMSTHAEIDALNKLKSKKNINLKNRFDLMVIRISKTGILGESRPCFHCLQTLEKSGVKIHNVYYSTEKGKIVREKFNTMKESKKTTYSSGYRRSMQKHKKIINKFVYE